MSLIRGSDVRHNEEGFYAILRRGGDCTTQNKVAIISGPVITLILVTLTVTAANGTWNLSEHKKATVVKALAITTGIQGTCMVIFMGFVIYHFCQRRQYLTRLFAERDAGRDAPNYGAMQ